MKCSYGEHKGAGAGCGADGLLLWIDGVTISALLQLQGCGGYSIDNTRYRQMCRLCLHCVLLFMFCKILQSLWTVGCLCKTVISCGCAIRQSLIDGVFRIVCAQCVLIIHW